LASPPDQGGNHLRLAFGQTVKATKVKDLQRVHGYAFALKPKAGGAMFRAFERT
jgi:hypothetical protein